MFLCPCVRFCCFNSEGTVGYSNYYFMEYLFDGAMPDNLDAHTHYWLAATNTPTTITIEFPAPGLELTRVVLAPRYRADSDAPDFALTAIAAGGGPPMRLTPQAFTLPNGGDIEPGTTFEFAVGATVTTLTLSLSAAGREYLGFGEIVLYEPTADAVMPCAVEKLERDRICSDYEHVSGSPGIGSLEDCHAAIMQVSMGDSPSLILHVLNHAA
eukprot:SAG22_NODE_661_length_8059_cov_14.630402_2_plen_213_part_00